MASKTPAERLAEWIETTDPATFQETLNSGSDDFRLKILAALLSDEFSKVADAPKTTTAAASQS
jgi:hypothetical protein